VWGGIRTKGECSATNYTLEGGRVNFALKKWEKLIGRGVKVPQRQKKSHKNKTVCFRIRGPNFQTIGKGEKWTEEECEPNKQSGMEEVRVKETFKHPSETRGVFLKEEGGLASALTDG